MDKTTENTRKHNILKLSVIDSTNVFAREHFEELRDKTAVVADYQTAGRGRAGRSWYSLDGNLFLTLVLKPTIVFSPTSAHSCLTHYLAVSLCLVLEKLGLKPGIKWPNDIHVDGKKIAGILAESVLMPAGKMGIILGIGVNLNMRDSDFAQIDQPATSLLQLLPPSKRPTRDHFLRLLLNTFFDGYADFIKKGFPSIQKTYDSFLLYKGEMIRLDTERGTQTGVIRGVSSTGALLLVDSAGKHPHEYYAGDVWLE